MTLSALIKTGSLDLPEDFLAGCCNVSPQGLLDDVELSNCVQRIRDRDGLGSGVPLNIQQLERLLQSYKAKAVEVRVRDSNT